MASNQSTTIGQVTILPSNQSQNQPQNEPQKYDNTPHINGRGTSRRNVSHRYLIFERWNKSNTCLSPPDCRREISSPPDNDDTQS